MKHLLLLRHAKAEQSTGRMQDRDRPLAERGHHDAALIGSALASEPPPDLILCSPALRTRETLAEVLSRLGRRPPTDFEEELYSAPTGDYLDPIREAGGEADRLLVVGHNPTIHRTALMLAGAGEEAPRLRLAEKFPTGALAVFALPIDDWAHLGKGSGTLERLLFPSQLRDADRDD